MTPAEILFKIFSKHIPTPWLVSLLDPNFYRADEQGPE